MNARFPIRIAWLAYGVVAVLATATLAQTPRDVVDIDYSQHSFLGTKNACKKCHEKPTSDDLANGITDRIELTEWKTWHEEDKHSKAYEMLDDDRGRQMARLMNKSVQDKSTGCIQCHTSNANQMLWDTSAVSNSTKQRAVFSEGVGCEACHGPASDWVGLHFQRVKWSEKTDLEKSDVGFRPIHDALFRAELCLSCHVGNARENKVITHEMYAAGHPPLSGFELEAFADKMPDHWRQSYEKGGRLTFERTRNLLVANVVSLRLAFDLAAVDLKANPIRQQGLDLARLECYSCHHDLRLPSWRQTRNSVGRVGRPRLSLGCEPLLIVAARAALEETGVQQAQALLAQIQTEVFAQNVFGDSKAIQQLQPKVQQWCLDLEANLLAAPLNRAKAEEVLADIYDAAGKYMHDYDTARQLTGAIVVICDEIGRDEANPAAPSLVQPLVAKLRKGFNLHVDMRERVEETLKQSLENRERFSPETFSRLISSLETTSGE